MYYEVKAWNSSLDLTNSIEHTLNIFNCNRKKEKKKVDDNLSLKLLFVLQSYSGIVQKLMGPIIVKFVHFLNQYVCYDAPRATHLLQKHVVLLRFVIYSHLLQKHVVLLRFVIYSHLLEKHVVLLMFVIYSHLLEKHVVLLRFVIYSHLLQKHVVLLRFVIYLFNHGNLTS